MARQLRLAFLLAALLAPTRCAFAHLARTGTHSVSTDSHLARARDLLAKQPRGEPVARRDLIGKLADAGGGEISIAVLALVAAGIGGSVRTGVAAQADQLEKLAEAAMTMRDADAAHSAQLTLTSRGGLKAGERAIVVSAPRACEDTFIDLLWLRDAQSGAVLGATEGKQSRQPPSLTLTLQKGQHVLPLLHCADGTVLRGVARGIE